MPFFFTYPSPGRAMAQAIIASFSPHRTGIDLYTIHAGFVVDKVALGQFFLLSFFGFSPVNNITPWLCKLISSGG
jgi:hypothetical protein